MRIDKLRLQNFRYFENLEVEFLPKFNVIIGSNGSGKSSLMEGLCMAASAFFLGIDEASQRKFQNNDTRYVYFQNKPEYQFPVSFSAWGIVDNQSINWAESQEGKNKKINTDDAIQIKQIAENLQKLVRKGEGLLPIISYFGANRLWETEKAKETEEDGLHLVDSESRLAAYRHTMRPIANYDFLKKWFISKELATLQALQRENRVLYDTWVIKKAVKGCVENCEDIYYNLETKALLMKMTDGRTVRWNTLSDGQKNMLAIAADIAYRCINLNPQMGEKALETSGIVLIDEIDVHLHPNWQKKVVQMLKTTFPNIQFIVTTHSPLVLHSLELGDRIITLEDNQAYYFDNGFGRDVNDTLQKFMNIENTEDIDVQKYFGLIEVGEGLSEKAVKLREKIKIKQGIDSVDLVKADVLLNFY